MRRFMLNRNLKRFLLDENIYFSGKQIRKIFNISESCLSRHLKQVLMIPGCQSEYLYAIHTDSKRRFYACREFLGYYHRVLLSLHQRIAGPNYQIPMTLTAHEFQAFANRYTPQYITDPLD